MILNKETRNLVAIGDTLKDKNISFLVRNMWETYNGKGICVSVEVTECDEPWLKGRWIYGEGLSNFYGLEIVKG